MRLTLLSCLFLIACGGDSTTTGTDSGPSPGSGLPMGDSGGTTETQDSGSVTDTDTIDTTDTADTTDTVPPTDTEAQGPTLADLVDFSVNGAVAAWSSAAGALVLDTAEGRNPPGGFNGGGKGSMAIAGVPGLDGTWLTVLESITIDALLAAGTAHVYLNLQLDLACDGTDVRILVVDETTLGDPVELASGFSRYTVLASEPQWKAVGALDDLLPGHLDGQGKPLGPVVEAYPFACLVDVNTGLGGMPADAVTSSVLVVLGDSGTTDTLRWGVGRLTVNDTVWSPPSG
jgi:hypothetical protein